jgi:hypothetical protein
VKKLILLVCTLSIVSQASAQEAAKDCENMASLRNRTYGLSAALTKIEMGGKVNIKENADISAQLLTLIAFSSYICHLNAVLPEAEKIKDEDRANWESEINETFRKLSEAAGGQGAKEVIKSTNAAVAEIEKAWAISGPKRTLYTSRLTRDYSREFLANTKAFDPKSVTATAHVVAMVKQISVDGSYDSRIAEGEEVVGNLLQLLKEMRGNIGTYAAGKQNSATMLAQLINRIQFVGQQIATRKATALQPEEFAQTLAFNGTPLVKDLQKKVDDLQQQVDSMKKAVEKLSK